MAELQITTIKFVDKSASVINEETERINNALSRMGSSVHNLAKMYAPYASGELLRDGRVNTGNLQTTIAFGGFKVPYARRRHYENNLHPNTKLYLERAGNEIAKRGVQYYL